MLSGGSPASASVTCAARTVTVHVSPPVKSLFGLSVNVVAPPLSTKVCAPVFVHEIVNDEPVALTASLNVTVTSELGPPMPPFVGVVAVTVGAASVVNEKMKFASMLSGGSFASASLTWFASTVTVHVSNCAKSTLGSIVNDV